MASPKPEIKETVTAVLNEMCDRFRPTSTRHASTSLSPPSAISSVDSAIAILNNTASTNKADALAFLVTEALKTLSASTMGPLITALETTGISSKTTDKIGDELVKILPMLSGAAASDEGKARDVVVNLLKDTTKNPIVLTILRTGRVPSGAVLGGRRRRKSRKSRKSRKARKSRKSRKSRKARN